MLHFKKFMRVFFAVAIASSVLVPGALASSASVSGEFGTLAYGYTGLLSAMPRFFANYADQMAAAGAVKGWLEDQGYHAGYQQFLSSVPAGFTRYWLTDDARVQKYLSQNVVAFKRARDGRRGSGVPLVIIGAHYDAVPDGQGADDNASGVGALLETTARLAEKDLPYELAIVAFGAEEAGLLGSERYVKEMSRSTIGRTIVMINFDSLIAGDFRYIHAGSNGKIWARDDMLRIIGDLGLGIITQPGLNRRYPAGFTPNGFSDYTAFNKAGIPVVAFESTNWSVGHLDGYQQTAEPPYEFWHSEYDVLSTIEDYHPGRPLAHLSAYTRLVYEFLANLEP